MLELLCSTNPIIRVTVFSGPASGLFQMFKEHHSLAKDKRTLYLLQALRTTLAFYQLVD